MKELLEGYPMPQIVEAALLPFRDAIIHDGIVPLMACAWAKICPGSLNRSIWKQKYN